MDIGQANNDNQGMDMIAISILAVEGCLHSAVHGFEEILTLANSHLESPLFTVNVVSVDGATVKSFTGSKIVAAGHMWGIPADIIILPPMMGGIEKVCENAIVINWLTDHHASGKLVTSICAGSFLLAKAGILDGRPATTHWNLATLFRHQFPLVDLQIHRLLVDGGDYICAGGVSAWMDLALHLISRFIGREESLSCAKMMLMDPNRDYQTPYGMGGFPKNHGDSAILKIQNWLEENYTSPLRLKDMATQACLGERTLMRRFKTATGITPLRYLQQVRIAAAQNRLESTVQSIDTISSTVGYEDYSTFRKAFKQILGVTPSSYRERFGLRS